MALEAQGRVSPMRANLGTGDALREEARRDDEPVHVYA